MLSGWTLTFSFFGASVTLARQPDNTWTRPQNAKLAAHASTRSARRKRRQSWRRLLVARSGSPSQSRHSLKSKLTRLAAHNQITDGEQLRRLIDQAVIPDLATDP
jgi:lipid-binding SYLF domain-containing protein